MSDEKPYEERIWLCEGIGKEGKVCPIRESCAFYRTSINKQKLDHWGICPYNFRTGKCDWFEKKEDGFNELNSTQCF